MGSIRKKVSSPKEYREAVKHAEALGLSLKDVAWSGGWESSDGEPIFLSGSNRPIEKAGYEYYHVKVSSPDGMVTVKVQPCRTSTHDMGTLALTFSD